jgi:PAS domain-containing protein
MGNADQNLNRTNSIRQNLADLERLKIERFGVDFSESEKLKLIHELEVHQIELELQNEELLLAKQQADSAIQKYTELYDFSPSGYFTLSREGIIIDANLTGSTMLGVDRINLRQAKFRSFLCNASKMEFDIFFDKIFINKIRECCEICLEPKINTHYAYLSGIITEDEQFCHITVIDITDLNLIKNALQNSEERDRDLLYNVDVGIVVHNLETSIVMSNP